MGTREKSNTLKHSRICVGRVLDFVQSITLSLVTNLSLCSLSREEVVIHF